MLSLMASIQKYIVLEKKVGQTPLVVLENYRKENPEVANKKLAYAGRLDPMASGKLLVLIGDACKKQGKYLNLDKEYEFEVLLDFKSDSGDVLGLAEYVSDTENLNEIIQNLTGKISLPYPKFSSRPVAGKPLFLWTLEGRINEIEIPTKESTVYKLSRGNTRTIDKDRLAREIFEKINSIPEVTEESKKLGADFRRVDIRKQWQELLNNTNQNEFTIAKFTCTASSGTYMRSLAQELGGLAYSIHRTTIGKYQNLGPIGLWYKKY